MAETVIHWQPEEGTIPGDRTYIDPVSAEPWVDAYLADQIKLVKHGNDPALPRPTEAGCVWWMGAVQPAGMITNDYWSDTATNQLWQVNGAGTLIRMAGAGSSAYELAVEQGFVGTLADWLASLAVFSDGTPSPATEATRGVLRLAGDILGSADAPVVGLEAAGLSDEKALINTYLAAGPTIRRLIGDFTIAGVITVPEGVQVDASRAVLRQTTSDTHMIALTDKTSWSGGELIGKTTDYVAAQGSFAVDAIGVRCEGDDITVESVRCTGFGNAGVFAINSARLTIRDTIVRGVHGLPGAGGTLIAIPAQDAACFGIYLAGGCPDADLSGITVTDASIGIIGSYDTERLNLSHTRFDRIKGQHGIYLQNSNGLHCSDATGTDVKLNLVKVQLNPKSTVGVDQYATTISRLNCRGCDTVLTVAAVATDLSVGAKFYGISVSDVLGVDCAQVAYFKSLRSATIRGITGRNVGTSGIQLIDAQDVLIDGVLLTDVGADGIRFGTATGAVSARISVRGVRVHNYGLTVGGARNAMLVVGANSSDFQHLTIDGFDAYSDTTAGQYGFWLQTGHQQSLRARHLVSIGHSGAGARLPVSTLPVSEWADVDTGGKPINWPNAYPVRVGTLGGVAQYACNQIPTMGVYFQGDRVNNSAGTVGSAMGWVQVNSTGGASSAVWAATTAYALGVWIRLSTGQVLECTTAGTTAGTTASTEPAPPGNGVTVTDGTAVFTQRATAAVAWRAMPNIAA